MAKSALKLSKPALEPEESEDAPAMMILKFADSKIPIFRESRDREYIKYGAFNNYPEYLTYLLDKSAKHNAIVQGKAKYIFGEGFANGDLIINRLGESLNDITKKADLDIEAYGGFKWEVVWNSLGKISEIYHVDFTTLRKAKDGGFFFRESWCYRNDFGDWVTSSSSEMEKIYIPCFNPKEPTGSQIYEYNEYRPMVRFYPLPGYIGCNNYIETDIEISKFHLSSIINGFMPSKMIQFFKGEQTDEKKREIENRFKRKFGGAENAGKFIMVFNDVNASQPVKVDDLSASELDKQFDILNKTCQQEIYAGHGITNPILFGIKTEGQLGGATELATAYSIFQNTYSKPKATALSKEVESVMEYSMWPGQYELRPTDPIGYTWDVKDVINSLPKAYVFKQMGIPEDLWDTENIGADNRPTPTTPIAPGPAPATPAQADVAPVNEHLKNLSPKQYQSVLRVRRDYHKGRIDLNMAMMMLRSSLGLSDDEIRSILSVQPGVMSADDEDNAIIGMFDACGDVRGDYEIIKSKPVSFERDLETDETIFKHEAFKTYDVTGTEAKILDLIKKDKYITPEVIAKTIGQSVAYVESKLENLQQRGYINVDTMTVGEDVQIVRQVAEDLSLPPATIDKAPVSRIKIMYSYEGPNDDKNRPFCKRMLELDRLYSRADIEQISVRLGYSVFDRRGGFWTRKGTDYTTPWCRHRWQSNIVAKK